MKYDYLFEEPICEGLNYDEYVKKHNVHVPKNQWEMSAIKNFDLNKLGIEKVPFKL